MKKYDLHIHTKYSKCSNLDPRLLLKIAKKLKFNGIAVTDHNTIKGSLAVKKLNKDKDFEVIKGIEVDTPKGSILAYYVNENIKSKTLLGILDEIKKQDGLAAIAHPFRLSFHSRHRFSYPIEKIKNKIDAIEAFNARNFPGDNKKAIEVADKLKIPKIAGSDTHFAFEFGKTYTLFEGSLRKAIKQNKTKIHGTITYGPFGGFLSFMRNNLL
jgi:predicted metal-dependent phosphoesterase TrpH